MFQRDYFVIITKYGFVESVYECYERWDSVYHNICYTNQVDRAKMIYSEDATAPRYARSDLGLGRELTAAQWAEEIGGELLFVHYEEVSHSEQSFSTSSEGTTSLSVQHSSGKSYQTGFSKFLDSPFEDLDEEDEESSSD